MGKIAAVDYGKARIGIATSDATKTIAFPYTTVFVKKDPVSDLLLALEPKMQELEKIIIGYPLNMNGKAGAMAIEVMAFAEKLEEKLSIPLELWDERLTTSMAEKSFKACGLSRKKRKNIIDPAAATIILQSYLDSKI